MWIVYENNNGKKKAIEIVDSESSAWLKCGELNSVYRAACGVRYGYERYS